jgi:hypothetical protein
LVDGIQVDRVVGLFDPGQPFNLIPFLMTNNSHRKGVCETSIHACHDPSRRHLLQRKLWRKDREVGPLLTVVRN